MTSLNTFAAPAGLANWGTPAEFKGALDAVYHFDPWDPCPLNAFGMRDTDGLGPIPQGVLSYFCNPPYDDVAPWLDQAIAAKKRGITAVMLLRVDTSTIWMHDRVFPYARPIWVRGRIKFKSPPGPCMSCGTGKGKERKPAPLCRRPDGHPSPFASVVAAYEPRVRFPAQSVMWQDLAGVWHIGPRVSVD